MALVPSSRYPGQIDSSGVYPQGKARNAGSFQDGTGTPLEKDWINDLWGFLQALLAFASITPSGSPDQVGASQYLAAVEDVASVSSERSVLGTWTTLAGAFSQSQSDALWIESLALFVTVGAVSTAYTSPDAVNWTSRTPGANVGTLGFLAGVGVVGVGNTGAVTLSADAITWGVQVSGTVENLRGVAAHGALFIVVGDNGKIITSPNGVAWTSRTSGVAPTQLLGVASNGTIAVAVGATGTIITSPDGITWTTRTSGVVVSLGDVVWNGSLFIVAGSSATILTSPDGITWTLRTVSGFAGPFFGLDVTDNYVLALGNGGELFASRDGITWRRVQHGITAGLGRRALAWSGAAAVTVGDGEHYRSAARLPV
jgi:hypothetical protein